MVALVVVPAAAEPGRLTFKAGRVETDAALTDVLLEQSVELRYDRYRVTSQRLQIRRDPKGVSFEGDARIALCPCPDPPLTFKAGGGRFDPTGDLTLVWPRIEIGKVPVFGLPWIWIRTPDRPGILPPIIALRSTDGLLLGSGVHLPWQGEAGRPYAIDLTAAGYTSGGAQFGASLSTPESRARAVLDLVHGTRAALEARGASEAGGPSAVAWQVDAIRGDRARSATVDLAPAAQPFDTGAVEASLRTSGGPVSAIAAGALIARAIRGEGPIAAGPRATLAVGGTIARTGSWSADAAGAVLGGSEPGVGAAIGRAAAGAEVDARPGPVELRASARARARYAGGMEAGEASREAAGALWLSAALPLVRTFAAKAAEAPLVHWIAPEIAVRGALADVRGTFFAPIEGRVPATSWIAAGGVSSAIGRYAGPAIRADVKAGVTGDVAATAQALVHARIGADARWAAIAIEAAAVGDRFGQPGETRGHAILGRGRIGVLEGPWLRIEAAEQRGAGAGQARAIASGAWAALPGDDLAYLDVAGITFGTEISVPWTRTFRTGARGDVDLSSGRLLSVRALAEYRHPCGCLGLGLTGAHRAGREGADVALTIDVLPAAAPSQSRF